MTVFDGTPSTVMKTGTAFPAVTLARVPARRPGRVRQKPGASPANEGATVTPPMEAVAAAAMVIWLAGALPSGGGAVVSGPRPVA